MQLWKRINAADEISLLALFETLELITSTTVIVFPWVDEVLSQRFGLKRSFQRIMNASLWRRVITPTSVAFLLLYIVLWSQTSFV